MGQVQSSEPLEHARELIARDEPGEAERILRDLFDSGERAFDLIIELVLCHLLLRNESKARRYLTMAEALDGGHSRVGCYRGFLALIEGRHEVALEHLSDALRADPRNAEAYKWRGLCYRELGDTGRALADLDRAAAHLKNDAQLLINRGTVHADIGNTDRALEDFLRACEISPGHAHPHYNAGHVLVDAAKIDQAQAHYDRAIELDHRAIEAWMGLADVFTNRREWSEVLRCLSTVLALDPDSTEAHYRVGRVFVELGDFDLGAHHLDRVLEQAPDDADAITFKAVAHFHLGEPARCTELCDRAISLAPEFGLPRLYRGISRLECGVAPQQGPIEDLEQARSLAPHHPGPPLALSEICVEEGEEDRAVELLLSAVKLDPSIIDRLSESQLLAGLAVREDVALLLTQARRDGALSRPRVG